MRLLFLILILSIPTLSFSQKNMELSAGVNIDSILVGTWKLKESENDSRFIFSSTKENEISCKVYQYMDEGESSSSIVHETKVEVIEQDSGYELKWDYQKFYWKGRIEKLKPRTLIVEINGKSLKFVKSNE